MSPFKWTHVAPFLCQAKSLKLVWKKRKEKEQKLFICISWICPNMVHWFVWNIQPYDSRSRLFCVSGAIPALSSLLFFFFNSENQLFSWFYLSFYLCFVKWNLSTFRPTRPHPPPLKINKIFHYRKKKCFIPVKHTTQLHINNEIAPSKVQLINQQLLDPDPVKKNKNHNHTCLLNCRLNLTLVHIFKIPLKIRSSYIFLILICRKSHKIKSQSQLTKQVIFFNDFL